MTSRQLRLLRGAAVSSIATVIAALSHTTGGGAPPHPLLVLALSILLTPVAALLVGRTLSFSKLSVAVLLSQQVFHTLFVLLRATISPGATFGTGHQHAMTLGPLATAVAPDAGMLSAHIIAAVFTIALLWRGERVLRAIAHWVRTALRFRMPRFHEDWPVPASATTQSVHLCSAVRIGDLFTRGPPAFSRG